MKRVLEENTNTVAAWDDIYSGPHRQEWTIWRERPLIEAFAQRLPVNASVLNLGAGPGWMERNVGELRPDIRWTGADLSPASIAFLRTLPVKWNALHVLDLNQPLPFPDNSFDAVTCSEVLEHIERPREAVAEMLRVARSMVAVTVPNRDASATDYHVWSISMADLAEWFDAAERVEISKARKGGSALMCFAWL
jgi:ubiquinone/menaquinone biosynthesis C-methylase UbiE